LSTTPSVIILCGGLGTRLHSVVKDRPKCLAEVNGRPFLAYLLDQVAASGLSDVVLATGHLGDQIQSTFRNYHRNLRLTYSQELQPLGTGGALRLAAIGGKSALVMNGDSYCDFALSEFIEQHYKNGYTNSIVTTVVEDTRRFGSIRIGLCDEIEAFEEKLPHLATAQTGIINAGIYMLSDDLIGSILQGRPVSLERDIFSRYLNGGLHAWRANAPFIDIGTPESFAKANAFLPAARTGIIFLDRDGTINVNYPHLDDIERMELLPGSADAIRRLRELGWPIAVVSNQAVVVRKACPPETVEAINARMLELLAEGGASVDGVYSCLHGPDDGCGCRKPGTELLENAAKVLGADLGRSFLVGDNWSDIKAGLKVGAKTILVQTGHGLDVERSGCCTPHHIVSGLFEAAVKIVSLVEHDQNRAHKKAFS
jgi:histidinol-phosphate phosphatase family protein